MFMFRSDKSHEKASAGILLQRLFSWLRCEFSLRRSLVIITSLHQKDANDTLDSQIANDYNSICSKRSWNEIENLE
jgi:hypothetical protein